MIEARFLDASLFKKIIDALKDFKEINLECSTDGISLKVMDECHVSLADLKLGSSIFEYYRCDAPCMIGLNVESLTKIIRQAPNERSLTLQKLDDSDRLRIESDEDPETGLRRAADIALISVTTEPLQVPVQDYQVNIEIPTKLYGMVVRDLSGVGEDLKISVTAQAVKFESEGEKGRVENVFRKGEGAFAGTDWRFDNSRGDPVVEQTFAVRFLAGFSKACPLTDTAVLSMSKGIPIRLQFPLSRDCRDSFLSYYAAPTLD